MTTTKKVTVGSRASPLSQAQTEEVLRQIRAAHPDVEISILPLSTGGDRNKTAPLLSMGRGMFVKEIELALLNGEIDFAVHSAKDLPALLPEGLLIAAFSQRQDPRDVLIDRWGLPFMELPAGARLGTSSPRRTAQLKALRPDIDFLPIRGNVGTRMEKARGQDYDGVVLAAAGLVRLGRESEISEYLSPDICTPDVGQGALAVEARADEEDILRLLASIDHHPTSTAVRAERAFLKAMGGGCTVPVAAYAQLEGEALSMSAMAARPDGSEIIRFAESYDASNPELAGHQVAENLLKRGAASIISKDEAQ